MPQQTSTFEQEVRTFYGADGRVCRQTVLLELSVPTLKIHVGHEMDNEYFVEVLSETIIATSDCSEPVPYESWVVGLAERHVEAANVRILAADARREAGTRLNEALLAMSTMAGVDSDALRGRSK